MSADDTLNLSGNTTTALAATYKNVTGQFDTSNIRESNFNTTVEKDTTPTYETRTVMVTLSGDTVSERAAGANVDEYINTWSGQRALASIASEQQAFLNALNKTGVAYKKERAYNTVLNAVAIEINTKHVSMLKSMAGVESVVITTSYAEPETYKTSSTTAVSNETNVYETGIYDSSDYAQYGAGSVVAVLDTGLDYTHPAFQGFMTEGVEVAWTEEDVANKLATQNLSAESRSGSLNASEVYVSAKVPFAYDYADDDADVYPSYSNHGTHVAGIIGGYNPSVNGSAGYTDKDGNPIYKDFVGVVPDAQLVICKVFTDDLDDPDLGGAVSEDIIAALDDCVKLGVDVINMSLGTSCGFTTTNDGDDEGEMLHSVYTRIQEAGISLVCAASNDYSAGYGGVYGTNLSSNPDSSTVGSPSTFAAALSVASINGQKARYLVANNDDESKRSYVFYEESRDIDGNPFDFLGDLSSQNGGKKTFEYVVVPGIGQNADYSTVSSLFKDSAGKSLGRIALIKRGDTTFQEKVELAMEMGAIGVIVYNNVSGVIRMNLGEIDNPVPAVSINKTAGESMVAGAVKRIGTITLSDEYQAGPFMSEFSSWGPTHDLTLKPEITAHGGEITSTVPGGYGEQSGTSMASPNMAGVTALVRNYVKQRFGYTNGIDINSRAMQLIMSTAGLVYDQDGLVYSPRKQGAGVAKIENMISTNAYLWTDVAANDYRPKLEMGDDDTRQGYWTSSFKITNFGSSALTFSTNELVMTETLTKTTSGLFQTVSEQAHMLNDTKTVWTVNGQSFEDGTITVNADETLDISVSIQISDKAKAYIDESFENGMYVEGFFRLKSDSDAQCDLGLPFLAFYGDWEEAPMLDYSSFEVAAEAQDASIEEENKIEASVFATQPFTSYYNEKYILPMGGYVYLLPDDADPMYVDEDKCSVSRYNVYYGEGVSENYMTSTQIKAVYAGLLRNARVVKYKMYNVQTGELMLEDYCNRVGKAYSGGGSAVPANVELELSPEAMDLAANGTYRMEFEFFMNEPEAGEVAKEENTYEFSFTVDYEAPILEDIRVRYYNYKEDNKQKQRIYLDVDVFDNHYAQALMLCYPTTDEEGDVVLQLATDYVTPVRDAKKNGTTTVSLDITDIYEKYGSQLYVQLDDYALNTCVYQINIDSANAGVLPEAGEFELADGESSLTLDIYEAHKASLVFSDAFTGEADLSNFQWTSMNPGIAGVKNGEIVGLSAGSTEIIVSNRKGTSKTIRVTVTDTVSDSLPNVPSISFGLIKTDTKSLVKASGAVKVSAGMECQLEVLTDPWYYPMENIRFVWESNNPTVATVDANGNIQTLKKGSATIFAKMEKRAENGEWKSTSYTATVTLRVQNEFTVSNYTLTDYNGVGGVVTIPTDMNIWYIGEEAFKDNNNITKIIIPSSVIDIRERAFMNCSALEEVYFVSEAKQPIADADVAMIYDQAFYNCKSLKKIDFSNTKTVTLGRYCFAGDTALEEVVDMPSIGTMHSYAFYGCKALKSADLSGLHMSGVSVFEGCSSLAKVTTGKFTALGDYMFKDCSALRNTVTLHTPKIGEGAFYNCTNLAGVAFESPEGEAISYDIGKLAFYNCGKDLKRGGFSVSFGDEIIRSIGERAFAGSSIKTFGSVKGLKTLGSNAFANTAIKSIVLSDAMDLTQMQLLGIPFKGMTVTVATDSTLYKEVNGIIYNADQTKVLHVNPSVTGELVLPDSVTEIGAYAFAASKISSLKVSSALTKLGVGAFSEAELTSIDWNGAQLTEIPDNAFNAAKLTSIVLPDSVTKLGAYAFANAAINAFEANGLVEIGNNAFESCIALHNITLSETLESMGNSVFNKCVNLETVVIPSLSKLGNNTFNGATSLRRVEFGANVSTTGEYTFMSSGVREVVLGGLIESVETGAFYNARRIHEITLPDTVTRIADFAFEGTSSLATVNGIENVEVFGVQAFYNSGVTSLNLESAKEIGNFAFAVQGAREDMEAAYTLVNIPNAESIGNFAFLNGQETEVTLGASVKRIGYGAFASSSKLTEIKVENNDKYFVEDGVLYRYVNKAEGTYEALSYPTAYEAQAVEGKKVLALKDGTVLVQAYAFYDLNDGALDEVVLPYSINSIGDSAFFMSGVLEYTFESIEAPKLETVYRSEIDEAIQNLSTIAYYKGYFYTNFETYLYNFSSYVREESNLILNYPANGVGYDNYLYSLYFGERNVTDILPEDETRECITLITEMESAEEVKGWLQLENTEENKAIIEAFSVKVKAARQYYNNATQKEGQAQFVSAEMGEKLLAVEAALREVKAHFGIVSLISDIRTTSASTHKTSYLVGETFDMTGLVVEIVYDDYSTEIADSSKLVLKTGALSKYDRYVVLTYPTLDANGNETLKEFRISVTVTSEPNQGGVTPGPGGDDSSSGDENSSSDNENSGSGNENSSTAPNAPVDSTQEESKGCGATIGLVSAAVIIVIIGLCVWAHKANTYKKIKESVSVGEYDEDANVNVLFYKPKASEDSDKEGKA